MANNVFRVTFHGVLLCSVMTLSGTAYGAVFCANNAAQFQTALDSAATNAEDNFIKLSKGDYVGTFVYASTNNSKLSIVGGYDSACSITALDATTTTITPNTADGADLDALVFSAKYIRSSFTLKAVTIKNATGVAVKVISDSDVVVDGVNLISNGKGVTFDIGFPYSTGPSLVISNSKLNGNSQAVHLTSGSNARSSFSAVTFRDNEIKNNSYGGVHSWQPINAITLTGNVVSGNTGSSALEVGAVTTMTVNNNIFSNNVAGANSGGALNAYSVKRFSAENNVFDQNECGVKNTGGPSGGAISLENNTVAYIANNYFKNNKAGLAGVSGGGGAIYITNLETATIVDNVIVNNASMDSGGGISLFCFGSRCDLINNTVVGNTTINGSGGGLYVAANTSSTVNLYNNIVVGNVSNSLNNDVYFDNDYDGDYVKSPATLKNNAFNIVKIKSPISADSSNITVENAGSVLTSPGSGDFSLKDGSLLIDKGSNTAPSLPAKAYGGTDRIRYGTVDIGAYEWSDTKAPAINNFTIPSDSAATSVPVTLDVYESHGSVEYCLTEANDPSSCSWSIDKPTYYQFDSEGNKSLFAFAKDTAGNVSPSSIATTTIDFTPPEIRKFLLPATSLRLYVPVSDLSATDNIGVTGYMITETDAKPVATATGWVATPPTSYTFAPTTPAGVYSLYAWAKDRSGNVSSVASGALRVVPNPSSLSVGITGTGSGNVNSSEPGLACGDKTCSGVFEKSTAITLFATPSSISTFTGWGGACAGTGACNIALTFDTNVTANFRLAPKAMINKIGYDSLSLAYAAAPLTLGSTTTVLALNDELAENLILNADKKVVISGGYNADFAGKSGAMTRLNGVLKISKGTLIANGLLIK